MSTRRRGVYSRLVAGGAVLLMIAAAAACGSADTDGSAGGGTLHIAEGAEQPTLDPAKNIQYLSDEMAAIYDTLVVANADGTIGPSLAESWTVEGPSITFKLRTGVKFHDGTPFNAAAVKAALDRVVDPATKATNSKSVLGPYQQSGHRRQHREGDLEDARGRGIDQPHQRGPQHPVAGRGECRHARRQARGNRPLQVRQLRQGRPPRGRAEQRLHDDPSRPDEQRRSEVRADHLPVRDQRQHPGEPADHRGGAGGPADRPRRQASRLRIESQQRFLPRGQRDRPVDHAKNVPDLNVRKAISAAIDRDALIQAVASGYAETNWSTVPTIVPGYDKTVESAVTKYGQAQAKSLLAAAGYTAGADGVMQKDGKPLTLSILSASDDPWPAIDQLVQDQLAQVGIKAQIKTEEFATVTQTRRKGDQSIYIGRYGILDPAGSMRILFACANIPSAQVPQGTNLTFNCNPDVDAALDQAISEVDAAKRNALVSRAQHLMAADHTALVLYQPKSVVFSAKAVGGIGMQPDGILKINDLVPAE